MLHGALGFEQCPVETMKRVVSQMHLREVTFTYRMTETSPVSFQNCTNDPLVKRVTTGGRVQPNLNSRRSRR
ncbi:hypothetical protein GCT13_18275 [Paraburkholderia sp. CNPSo 3157]|uniref:Uncharacterized protein n=1 Tax=Paraburkholderia franconis TaxID=2654983 RepID=A0A7X1TGU3_9BURK|nr:hypothetical protein [Paraburkholderia franconis]